MCSGVPTSDFIHPMLSACGLRPPGRWLRKNRKGLEGLSVHEQMRLAARCVSDQEARQAFAASDF